MSACVDSNPSTCCAAPNTPFDPGAVEPYRSWREAKLAAYPSGTDALRIDVADPLRLSAAELAGLRDRIHRYNMAIYRVTGSGGAERACVHAIAQAMGLRSLDRNPYADKDHLSALSDRPDVATKGYIPYSNRALSWHTDGYYNPPGRRIGAFIIHCVRPSAEGGANELVDPEMVYLALRERDPELVKALMSDSAMTIPANESDAAATRAEQSGPVFSVDRQGALHMRYTARTRSIRWHESAAMDEARGLITALLTEGSPYHFSHRLEAGEGLVCNNVLHNRSAYVDTPEQTRLLYRARYHERIS